MPLSLKNGVRKTLIRLAHETTAVGLFCVQITRLSLSVICFSEISMYVNYMLCNEMILTHQIINSQQPFILAAR